MARASPPRYILSSHGRRRRKRRRRRFEVEGKERSLKKEKEKKKKRGARNEREALPVEARKSEKGRLAAVYYFVCWKAGLLARPGGQSEACFHGRPGRWPTNPAPSWREHATSRVDEHLLPASRVAPVFPFVETFYATFPTIPLSLLLSLSEASPCAFVRLSVYPLYMCLWLAALCFARQASYFFSPAPLLPFPLPPSLSPRFSLYRTSLASMEREARTAAHLFALIGGHR